MHIHKIFYIKTFKIASTCFDPKIIFRELHCSLLKSHFEKHSLINFLILTWCCGSMSYFVSRTLLRMRVTMGVCRVLRCVTQHGMLPQHPVNIRKLISECFSKCDLSKEQCSSLKMILGSKHVGAILNVLM